MAEAADRDWWAVIGPAPENHENHQRLSGCIEIGPLILEPVDHEMWELAAIRTPPQLGPWGKRWSWPVQVQGTVPRVRSPERLSKLPLADKVMMGEESETATRQLHRLRGLLALTWDRHWTVREMPGPEPPYVPRRLGPPEIERLLDDGSTLEEVPVEVPSWVSDAWHVLEHDDVLETALGAHLDGVAIQDWHPSFALLAYVACIERVGQKLSKPERCTACGQIVGATDRFHQALSKVMPQDEADRLGIARLRSGTVHAAVLHGDEQLFGSLPDIGDPGPRWSFGSETVGRLRKASAELLRGYLGG